MVKSAPDLFRIKSLAFYRFLVWTSFPVFTYGDLDLEHTAWRRRHIRSLYRRTERSASALLACQPGGLIRKKIADKESYFFNCLHALTVATVVIIANLVEAVPFPVNPSWLRRRCRTFSRHGTAPPAAAAGQPEAVAGMLRLCPRCQERTTPSSIAFFSTSCPGSSTSCSPKWIWIYRE